jgi:deoxycytidine triphosphate deaminase
MKTTQQAKSTNPLQGAVIAQATLKQLIEGECLVFHLRDKPLTYDGLSANGQLDETSVALHIGELFRYSRRLVTLDLQGRYDLAEHYETIEPDEQGGVILEPDDFLLGRTLEKVTTPKNVVGIIEERRTVAGNLGLVIKGFIPPGLEAEHVRLTIYNFGKLPVRLYVGKIPPMKAMFYTLSSAETYRKGRQARVGKGQTYSSGAGNASISQPGMVLASLTLNSYTRVKQPITISFRLENASMATIRSIKIFPLLNTDVFRIIACSHGWHLDHEEPNKQSKALSFLSRTVPRVSSISSESLAEPHETVYGTFGIVFLEAMSLPQFKCEITCYSSDGAKLLVKYPTDSPPLMVESRRPVLTTELQGYVG